MKKLMISLLALYLASSVNAQSVQKQIKINTFDVREMINTIDEVLFWHNEDAAECECIEFGSYEEKWGSNYWLRVIRDQLYDQLHTQRAQHAIDTSKYVYITYEGVDCENCDEID
jgi:thioredoxin-related protein